MTSSRSFIITPLILLVTLLQTSCMTGARVATKMENADRQKAYAQNITIFKQHIKALQDKGDPSGDYFYALGNSDGWIKDVKDPKGITALFEGAAAKGSMDAKILLALQEATSEPIPGQLDDGMGPRENLNAWESGLAKLLPLLQQQCYVRRLAVGDGILSEARPNEHYYSIAGKVSWNFRDGYYRRNPDGTRTLLKDPVRQKVWEDMDHNCKFPPDMWLDTLYRNKE